MFYTLEKKWRLCGWKGLPFALENTEYGSVIFFDREQYSFLLECDGRHDLEIAGYSETTRRMIRKLIEEGIVRESEECRPVKLTEYVLYPVGYRKKAHWSITGRCNYRCRHCLMSAPEGRFPHPSFEQLLFIADKLKECGVLCVDLTGGEPLIRPDFLDLVDALHTRGIRIGTIFTNGKLVTRKLLEELKRRDVRCSFQISYDGVGGWHDWMRGIDGASEDTERAIRLCVEYGFRVICAMCLHKESVSVLRESVRYLAGLGVNLLKVNAAVPSGDWKKHPEYFLSTEELFRVFLDYIPRYFEDDCPLDIELDIFFLYNRGDREYTNGADRDPGIAPEKCLACRSTKLNFYIGSDGSVVPCMAMAGTPVSKQFYNIFETDLKEILGDHSRLTKAGELTFREIIDHNPACRECPHAPICQGGCRARATGELYDDYLRPDPINCEFLKGAWREKIQAACGDAFQAYKQRIMKTKEYSKFKECRPEETVCRIQELLGRIGLFPIYRWTGISAEGTFSNRITLHPSIRGTNGKGTSQAYALASGFAELMERLENNVLLFRGGDVVGKFGFMEAPDETELLPEELMKNPDPFTQVIIKALEKEPEGSRAEDLLSMLAFRGSKGETLRMLPYADPGEDRVTYLPIHLVRYFNGTNGMAAGNTMEEAMVQGLSELIEREVNRLVMEGKVSAPTVPDEELSQYSFFSVIEKLRAQKRYRVDVLDYSLGKGWPVAGLVVVDLERGTFGIKFGAHPSFPIAVERTLTEAAQGSTFEQFAASCRIGTEEEVFADMNLFHVAKNGKGVYPASLFTLKPGWAFRKWTRFRGNTNRELLAEFMQLLKEEGLRVLYRDASFLGFPACHIVIPGFHPIHAVNGRKVRLRRTEMHVAQNLKMLSELSVDDAERLLNLIRYNEGGRITSTVAMLHGLPLANPELSDGRIGLWLSIGFGEYALAEHFLDRLLADEKKKEERDVLLCIMAYLRYLRSGMQASEAAELIRALYTETCSERVCRDVLNPGAVLERLLVPTRCPDCGHCFYYGNGCDYPAEEEIYKKVTEEMKKNRISQDQLLLWLHRYQ